MPQIPPVVAPNQPTQQQATDNAVGIVVDAVASVTGLPGTGNLFGGGTGIISGFITPGNFVAYPQGANQPSVVTPPVWNRDP